MILLDFVSETFDRQYAYLYQLSAVVGPGRFAFLVEDEENRVVVLRATQPDAREETASVLNALQLGMPAETMLRLNYRSVRLAFASQRFVLVPAALFDPAQATAYLEAIAPLYDGERAQCDYLRAIEAYAVYPASGAALDYVGSFFTRVECRHWASGLLLAAQQNAKLTGKPYLQATLLGRMLCLVLFDKGKLLYCNIFEYVTARDALYHVLLVYDQLKLHPERQPVYLSGEVVPDSEIYRELTKYIRQVDFVSRPAFYRFPSGQEGFEAPGHFYQDLYSIKLLD